MQGTHGKKLLRKFFVASLLISGINFSPIIFYENNLQIISVVHAEIRTYEAVGRAEFNFGENNPQLVEMAKNYARMDAEQNAKEKAGIYLKSFSRTLGGNVTDDDISVVANNSTEIIDVKFKQIPYVSHDVQGNATGEIGIAYEATITVKIDSNKLSRYVQRNPEEKYVSIEQNKSSQKNITDINKQVEDLKRNPQKATSSEIEKINSQILAQQKLNEGLKLHDQQNYQEAISKYNEAIQLNPNFAEAYTVRGVTYYILKEYNQAIMDCNKAIQIAGKKQYVNYLTLGMIYSSLQNHKQAILEFNIVVKLNPNDVRAYDMRGMAYFLLKNYKQALADLNKAVDLDSNQAFIYADRGLIHCIVGNYSQAIMDCNKAIQIDSKFAIAYYHRGIIYVELGKYDEAIADFTKAIELKPEDAVYYHMRGFIYEKLGKIDKAKADFTKAKALGYND